jgi:hypothetical protein
MKLVIAIFGLLSSLSAQVMCYPVDAKGNVDLALETKKVINVDRDLTSGRNFFTNYFSTARERCYEHIVGMIALGNGKIVSSVWVEVKVYEKWMSDSNSCLPSRSKEPLSRFSEGIFEGQGREPEKKSLSIPPEFCRATDYRPPATDH